MNDQTQLLWLCGLIYFSYSLYNNIREIKLGNEKKTDHYDDNSMMPMDQRQGAYINIFILFSLIVSYIMINYFGFK